MKPTSSTPRARVLAAELRDLREAHAMGVRELARALGFAPQLLSLWEKGLRVPPVTSVALILGYFRVSGEKQEQLLELAETAREPDWIAMNSSDILDHCEKDATRLTNWESGTVPGLLQTADYARAVIESAALPIDQVDRRVAARVQRQRRMLGGREPITLRALIDEQVLTNRVGDDDVMSDQMDRLLEASLLPHVAIRVVRPAADYHQSRARAFMIMEYDAAPPIVLLEHYQCGVFLSEAGKVAAFRALAKTLWATALSEEESRERISEAVR